ncbi:adhesin, partial [Providencia huaxiensis]
KGDILGHSGKLLGHSVVSGISAEIAGGNAKGAIVGSLAVQLAGITLNNNLINEKEWQKDSEKYAQLSRVLGGFAGAIFTGNAGGVYSGADSGESTFRFNHLLHELAMDFDNEMQKCAGNTNCEATQIKKYAMFSLINSGNLDVEITNNPLVTQDITKTRISNAFDLAKRPYWASYLGFDVMQNDLAKQYLMYWNSQDLNKINAKTPGWTKAAVLISDPEIQASVISLGWIGKQLIQKSVLTVSKLGSDEITLMIKSTQTGLKNPSQIDQMKIDMLSNNYRFTAPEGIIAGYVDKRGIHYISEGNHRMVAAKEIYVKTGDSQYINKLIENGRWTVVESAPAGAKPLPSRN